MIAGKRARIIVRLSLLLLSVQLPAHSQTTPGNTNSGAAATPKAPAIPTISTSRPSFTDTGTTVPQGSLQAESGATYTNNRDKTYSWTVPETLLRLGLTDNTEFRFTVPDYTYIGDSQPGHIVSNFGDISVGFSHHIAAPRKIDVALVPMLNLPTGAIKASSNSVDPQFRLVVVKPIGKWTISSHLDTRWFTGHNAPEDVLFNITSITYYDFPGKWNGFLEYSGFIPTTGRTTQFLGVGALFVPTPRQQFDARITAGLNNTSPDVLVGFGYSFRIDGLFGKSRDYATFPKMRRRRSNP